MESERLRFPGWKERRPLRETRRAARWLATWLEREVGRTVPVQGVLVLPGWRIEDAAASDLLVVSGDGLADQLPLQHPGELDTATHDAVIRALRQRVARMALNRTSLS